MFHPSDRSDDICRLFSLTVCRKKPLIFDQNQNWWTSEHAGLGPLESVRNSGSFWPYRQRLTFKFSIQQSQNREHASVNLVFEHPRTYCRTKQMFPRIQESALIFVEMFGLLQKGNVLESREDDLLQCLHEYLVFNCYVVKKEPLRT